MFKLNSLITRLFVDNFLTIKLTLNKFWFHRNIKPQIERNYFSVVKYRKINIFCRVSGRWITESQKLAVRKVVYFLSKLWHSKLNFINGISLTLTNLPNIEIQLFTRNFNFLPNLKSNFSNTLILFQRATRQIFLFTEVFPKISS